MIFRFRCSCGAVVQALARVTPGRFKATRRIDGVCPCGCGVARFLPFELPTRRVRRAPVSLPLFAASNPAAGRGNAPRNDREPQDA